jgi:class 3 adenylate cyclase/tetratricopeptide (TPR) repeat protein
MRCGHCGLENPIGMRFCGGCGVVLRGEVATTPSAGAPEAAHRRHMTVMFCDIVESTPLAERLDPEDFREILGGYQLACARAIERFDGYTARYAGDGLMAYFGYPRAYEDSAQRAVHAGLGILDELVALNVELRDLHGVSLRVRIGIHTGVVVAGEMGAGVTREPLAIVGETPHIAARLESIAAPGSVVISGDTHDLVEGYFETESRGEQTLKGVSRPISVHRVLRPTGAVNRLGIAGARRLTPLVGRDHELARLAQAWQQVKLGQGTIVHVTGEAGIGKSRIVRELADRLGAQVGAEQTWQCSPHHQTTALYPVIRFLERLIGLDRAESAENQLMGLNQAVADAGLDPVEAVPLLADLLAIRGRDDDISTALGPRDVRTATLHVLESLLVASPSRHPLLLVVEDLHWADPTTVELLGRITANLSDVPVLCVLTFRPDFKPSWSPSCPVVEVRLGPLTSEGVRAVAAWASAKALDPAVLDWVDAAADGVPLFVEETLKMLAHADAAAIADGGSMVVPPTLQGLLTERLDQLPELGELINTAAVLGREFDREQLEELWPPGGRDLEPALVQLAAREVLRPVDGSSSRLEFTHALLQEAAYERILRRPRRALHARVADGLIRSSAAVAEREPEVVAHHWSCAAQPAKAARYWQAAGARALERAAFLEASHHFRRGLEALDDISPAPSDELDRVDMLTHLGASLQASHGYAAAGVEEAYAKARSGCERASDGDRLVSVIRGEWMYYLLRSDYRAALELADEMLALAERGGDPVRFAEGQLYRGLVHMYLANLDRARADLQQAFTRYQPPARSIPGWARSLTWRWSCGIWDTARSRASAAISALSWPIATAAR